MHRPHSTCSTVDRSRHRAGFTLIEMLISVSLVLLMMVMFAEIFSMASSAMTLQQAIADNDQQVRAFSTVLREDLHRRDFRTVTPFTPGESVDLQTVPFAARSGYFYISINDPSNSVDNLLQFTARTTIKLDSGDESPFYGRASGLVAINTATGGGGVSTPSEADQHVRSNSQQPEHDDGELLLNNTGASTVAEISYFVRGGRLYRRVSMLRDPLPVAGAGRTQPRMTWNPLTRQSTGDPIPYFKRFNLASDPSPLLLQTTVNGEYGKYEPSSATGWVASDDYWNDFDYSAVPAADPNGSAIPDGAKLLLIDDLDNSRLAQTDIGKPFNRFGFDPYSGISREFSHADPAQAGFFFLGRYTLEEQSHTDFNFPQTPSTSVLGPNPLSYVSAPALADAVPAFEPDGIVDALAGGPRRGEDLLLSNVHAFDIDIWDDRIGKFLPIGHSVSLPGPDGTLGNADDIPGDYHRSRYQLTTSGSIVVPGDQSQWLSNAPTWMARTFDTWHSAYDHDGDAEVDADGDGMVDPAEDANGNGVFDKNYDPAPYRALTLYPPASTNGPYANQGIWQPTTAMTPKSYSQGDIVFPRAEAPLDYSFYYRCIQGGTARTVEPLWPLVHGALVEPTPMSGEPRWQAIRNVRPLRAIQIRVRFLHVASGKMRQMSLVHSLVD